MIEELLKNVCITHFFNPVEVMKLCELIPGEKTNKEIINKLSIFLSKVFNKGVVYGKDTVNFIGNRIGCFFMLKVLYNFIFTILNLIVYSYRLFHKISRLLQFLFL